MSNLINNKTALQALLAAVQEKASIGTPVTSINNKTGDVVLGIEDLGLTSTSWNFTSDGTTLTKNVVALNAKTIDFPNLKSLSIPEGTVSRIRCGETVLWQGPIPFTIQGKTYRMFEGMTWSEWINSSFNTDDYFLWESGVRVGDTAWVVDNNSTEINASAVIMPDVAYGTTEAALPTEAYQEFAYVRTNGNNKAYIDLGFAFDTAATIKMKYTANSATGYPFGAADSTGVYRCMISEGRDGDIKYIWAYGSDGSAYTACALTWTAAERDLTYSLKAGNLTTVEAVNGRSQTVTANIAYTMTDNLYLGAHNYKGSVRFDGDYLFKSFEYYNKDNRLICKLVPCRDRTTGIVGMYDIIRKQFLASISGTNFIGEPAESELTYTNWARCSTESDDTTIYNGNKGYKDGSRIRSGGAEGDSSTASHIGYIPVKAGDVIRLSGWDFSVATTDNAINVSDSSHTNIGQFTSQPASYGIFTSGYSAYNYSSVVQEKPGVWKWTVPPAASGIAYIRVSGKTGGAGEVMIITKNETIY